MSVYRASGCVACLFVVLQGCDGSTATIGPAPDETLSAPDASAPNTSLAANAPDTDTSLPPIIKRNSVTQIQGEATVISRSMISAEDDHSGSAVVFTVSDVRNGHFERLTESGTPITSFSHAEIDAGAIQFVHHGSITSPSWTIVATDESGLTDTSIADVDFELKTARGVPFNYRYSWGDEFTGSSVDESKWSYRVDAKGSIQRPEQVSLENGAMKIQNRIIDNSDGTTTEYGGGLVSNETVKLGYFETRVKTAGSIGWHEAYWFDPEHPDHEMTLNIDGRAVLELDVLEQLTSLSPLQTTSGIIGKGTRSHDPFREFESLASGDNFSDEFHIFGLEVTAEYIIHYIDREPVHILPIELLPFGHNYQYEWYTWLTSISTGNAAFPPTIDEDVFFDYSRSFILPDWGVDSRKEQLDSLYSYFYVDVLTERASAGSQGTDLWFEAERFPNEGLWSDRTDTEDRDYEGFDTIYLQSTTPSSFAAILAAVDGAQRVQRHPKALIPIENAGTYKLWVRSSNQPDGFDRSFAVRVNGITSTTALGTHGSDGFGWETVGTYNLDKTVAIELLKTTSDFARVDRFLLTSDLSYVPAGIGGADNVILNDGYNGLYAGSVTGNSIPSSVITAKSESQSFAGRPVNNLINESGLSGETHSTDPNTMWMNATSFNTPTEMIRPDYIMLELTSEHRLNFMKLWNFNFSGFENRGARAINIYYNNDVNDPGYLSTNPAAWTPLKSIFPDKATGADNYTPDAVNLEGVNATRLLLEINGEYGGSFTGLSEIQLFGDAL